jgi:hypothetical protein
VYKQDHIKVLKVLASEAPKRPTFSTKDIVETAFRRAENGDRRVRNAYRKIRKEGHAEIADRGEYRLTQSGVGFCAKAEEASWKFHKEDKPKKATKKTTKKASSKGTKKKVTKKATKKAAKKTAKKAPAKKATKKTAKKIVKRAAKRSTGGTKASGKSSESKNNGVPKDASAGSQLAF